MLIRPHDNSRYRQSLEKLAVLEASALFGCLSVTPSSLLVEELAGDSFLIADVPTLTGEQLRVLGRHSCICLLARMEGDSLIPLERHHGNFLPEDLPYVLKFKGKTNPDFTKMMINCARSFSDFGFGDEPLSLYDPMCGKATTLFCAAVEGLHTFGTDVDEAALHEAEQYLERSLALNRIKHKGQDMGYTLRTGGNVRGREYRFAKDAASVKAGRNLSLTFVESDMRNAGSLFPREGFHLIVSDLPYGVQHAPRAGKRLATLEDLAGAAADCCAPLLKKGGVLAFSFNTNTLSKELLTHQMETNGLSVLSAPPFDDFSHWVEQAVTRDILFAKRV